MNRVVAEKDTPDDNPIEVSKKPKQLSSEEIQRRQAEIDAYLYGTHTPTSTDEIRKRSRSCSSSCSISTVSIHWDDHRVDCRRRRVASPSREPNVSIEVSGEPLTRQALEAYRSQSSTDEVVLPTTIATTSSSPSVTGSSVDNGSPSSTLQERLHPSLRSRFEYPPHIIEQQQQQKQEQQQLSLLDRPLTKARNAATPQTKSFGRDHPSSHLVATSSNLVTPPAAPRQTLSLTPATANGSPQRQAPFPPSLH
jgi:hypothetical protein